MAVDTFQLPCHQIDFTLHNLPSATVRIDLPKEADAEITMLRAMPTIGLGVSYSGAPVIINSLSLQPRRLLFEVESPPSLLPLTLHIACKGAFVFGWIQVPGDVQTAIITTAQRIRIVGSSYWALPLRQDAPNSGPALLPPETRRSASASGAGKPATEVSTGSGSLPADANARG
ncbi:MAG TPA: hypothetical protein VFQ87_18265 [Bradyrhizobium sp.]|jgi:hypothetical protein|nr:hypothetical protein [Bradyrhizobium sp.]